MNIKKYFKNPQSKLQKRYEAIRLHYLEKIPLKEAAKRLNVSPSYLAVAKAEASELIKNGIDPFFIEKKPGPKHRHKGDSHREKIIELRKLNHSILDIKTALEGIGVKVSHETINEVLKEEGFSRLPRRTYVEKNQLALPKKIIPPRASELDLKTEEFSTGRSGAVLSFLPLIEELGIIPAIQNAGFPESADISAVSYVLSFLALKLIGNKRLSHDETWSLDRVLGLFAGLNVLPKSASLSSYSYRVSRECNRKFLLELSRIFNQTDEACDFNIDFKAIPHWGDKSVLEKNYATTRGKAVKSVLALIVQNVTTNRLAYTNAEITHDTERDAVIEFVDFWKENHKTCPKMLVFDSQVTIYENLKKLDKDGIKFLTLRQRRNQMRERARAIPEHKWQVVEVPAAKKSCRKVMVYDEIIALREYGKKIRQLIIVDHSKEPVFMLTNDFEASVVSLIRKYGQRWLVEQEIAEQIAFFHLNQLSSSVVVKVDFDLTLTLLAHNLYRVLGEGIHKYEKSTVATLHRRFIEGRAAVKIKGDQVTALLSKRSHSPLLFELPWMQKITNLSWHKLKIDFAIGTSS
jgi:transposase